MESARRLPPELDQLLARGGIILTGNQRAARTLRLDFDRQRQSEGLKFWQPPNISAWDTWLSNLWQQILLEGHPDSGSDRLLLNRTQELQLWRSVISADLDSKAQWTSLRSIDSLAAMAASSWQQLCAYQGQSRLKSLGISGDTRAFQRWAQSFARRCKTDLCLSSSELESAIAHAVKSGSFKPTPPEILLIGFDTFTPAQKLLVDELREAGISIAEQAPPSLATELHLATAADLNDELTQAALWLRRHLETNPDARIAIIHPDIASERGEIDRVFRQILAPELQDITANSTASPYEFSLGQPLAQQPMVATALKLLRWAVAPLAVDDISRLLLSPYFGSRSRESHQRARFDAFELRRAKLLRPELDIAAFINQVQRADDLRSLLTQLQEMQRAATEFFSDAKQKSFADWADHIRELLQAAAWASAAPDDSIEFQTRRKWESALDELATLDFEGTRSSFPQALGYLEQIAQQTLFAPESREAPIQIMSPQEAAGSRFDALYFLRASDLAWPVRPGMNPLLGWRLQRELRMPGSDAALDAEHARRITARLAASAPTVIFSYAKETADAHQRPSPTLAAFPLTPLAAPQADEAPSTVSLETLEDSAFIPLLDARVRGGSDILKLQAACGFRAFAEKRLRSTAPESREPGMDAAERGNIVHVALEHLWRDLHTQARLRALTSQQRHAALTVATDKSLARFQSAVESSWDAAYLDLQRERLHRLLSAWLEFELTRSPFEVTLQEKKEEDVAIGPLLISLRVDRIDRIFSEDGEALGEVILDYKTGQATPAAWKGDRPDEPQLPLYAALREPGTVAGIAFASLRPGTDMGMRGLEVSDGILPKASKHPFATLEDQIADWRRVLTNLATDFADGDARVSPKDYPATCKLCRQRILCRLDPITLAERAEESEDADA